ncbi:MAG: hypothetical protein E7L17_12945 [Clostridium sp.]|uniref:hypothetical protein n=1 Tax=Clostridium sp. TaxID=1506 RepID=UPI00290E980B|nr:hypothetical protein [Clostridium sp.]MDU7339008.1 hypothetical protein [Clostridium sp.]
MKTNHGLVEFAQAALKAKLGYVYGSFGQVCTTALLNQKAKQYPANNLAGGAMRTVGNKWLNRRVVDCSGLIKYYLMADKVGDNPTYNAKYDVNLFHAATEKGTINTLPEIPGICLYMPGHTAVYLGNGVVIEAAGTAYGVLQSKMPNCYTGRPWTHWYKAPGIEYLKKESVTTPQIAAPAITGLMLDTSSHNMQPNTVYDVLARCADKPSLRVVGRDIISVSDPVAAYNGTELRGYKIRIKALKPGFAHIDVSAAGQIKSCNFNVK